MSDLARTLMTIGGLFLIGLATDVLGRRTRLPRVTLLMLFGFAIGPTGFDLLAGIAEKWFVVVSHMALVMVGFLLGEKLSGDTLREQGRAVLSISVSVVVLTAAIVFAGLLMFRVPAEIALLLAGIATATDPAATADVVHEVRARGAFPKALLGIVAMDDAWGIIAFSLLLGAAQLLNGVGAPAQVLVRALWELGGGILLGAFLGVPMAYLTGRIRPGEPTLAEALGIVFLCGGIALAIHVSFLIAAITLGAVVANLARHHTRPFHAIENVERPFMILFFVLAGSAFQPEYVGRAGLVGAAYIGLRLLGRVAGGWAGGALCGAEAGFRRWMGPALVPQAGVAIGMALVASQAFPAINGVILPVAIGSTVVFEMIGPVLTRLSLEKTAAGAR